MISDQPSLRTWQHLSRSCSLTTTFLLVWLYSDKIESRLKRHYLPVAILVATAGLIIEQYTLGQTSFLGQVNPFLSILLILVAWQYSFRTVVFYTIGSALLELILRLFFPQDVLFILPSFIDATAIWVAILFSRTLAFLLVGYVVSRLVQAQRQQRQALAQANQKLVRHAATLEQLAITRERMRIARELHDTLAHTLSAQAVQTDAILGFWPDMPERQRVMLENMLASTRSGLDETRRALSALRASPLEDLGLAGALRTLAEDFSARHNLALTLHSPPDLDDLPSDVEQCFYRVAQEALENARRHAQATLLEINLQRLGDRLSLTIADDGLGFAQNGAPVSSQEKQKLGLLGMHERAEMIGAQLDIQSQPGRGTIVSLVWSALT